MQEVTYEGFGPGGVALVIETLTDNKNRTNQTVRNLLQEYGGHLGSVGATSFLFDTKGIIRVKARGQRENDELEIIDSGAHDIDIEEAENVFIVYTAANELGEVKKKLVGKGFQVASAELTKVPKNLVEVTDEATGKKLLELMEALEEEEEVVNVAANFRLYATP